MIKTKVNNYFQSLVINIVSQHMLEDKKLKTYASIKRTIRFETYLDIFSGSNMHCCIAKLRLNAQKFHIETKRYSNRISRQLLQEFFHKKGKGIKNPK